MSRLWIPTINSDANATVVSTTSSDHFDPVIATLTNGNFVIAYEVTDVTPTEIRFRIYNPDGTPASDEFVQKSINLGGGLPVTNPAIEPLPDGGFILAWQESGVDDDNGGTTIDTIARQYNADGSINTSAFRYYFGGLGSTDETLPDVAITENGGVVLVNQEAAIGDSGNIGATYFTTTTGGQNATGFSTASFEALSNGTQAKPKVAQLSNDNFVVVWLDTTTNQLEFRRAGPNSGDTGFLYLNGSDVVIADTGSPSTDFDVIGFDDGGFLVVWDDANNGFPGSGRDIYARLYDIAGQPVTDEILINSQVTSNQFDPAMAVSDNGLVGIAWEDFGRGLIVMNVIDRAGNVIQREMPISVDASPGTSGTIDIAALKDDRFVVTYQQSVSGADNDPIVFQIVDPRDGVIVGGPDTFTGTSNDRLFGNFTDDQIFGLGGNDEMFGFNGNDFLFGGNGDDILEGGAGTDALYGGAGVDTASYSRATSAVSARLDGAAPGFGDGLGDFLSSIENVTGSVFNDFLVGDGNNNVLKGLAGDDTLFGEGGDDTINGGLGADIINGGQGNDTITFIDSAGGVTVRLDGNQNLNTGEAAGDTYADIENISGSNFADLLVGNDFANRIEGNGDGDFLFGFGGDDILIGGAGADAFDGGAGRDTADYSTSSTAVGVRLDGLAAGSGDGLGDSFVGVEDINGSAFDDFLVGDGGDNIIRGGDGADTLAGEGGNDVLFGGKGINTLLGGAGSDLFFFDQTSSGFNNIISDFDATDDNEDLYFSGYLSGVFNFIGSGTFSGGGNTQARFDDTTKRLDIDFDGDGSLDTLMTLTGVSLANLDVNDFTFV